MIRLSRFGTGSPNDIAFSPEGKYLAVATGLGVFLYDATTFERAGFIDVNSDVTLLTFSADGKTLLLASYLRGNTAISLWNVETGQKIIEMNKGFDSWVEKIAYSNSGYVAAVGHEVECGVTCASDYFSPLMRVWSTVTGRITFEGMGEFSGFSRDGKTLYFPGNKSNALNVKTNEIQDVNATQRSADLEVILGSASDDNNEITATSINEHFKAVLHDRNAEVEIVDFQTNQHVITLQFDATYSLAVEKISAHETEKYIAATWNGLRQITLWDLSTGEKLRHPSKLALFLWGHLHLALTSTH